MRITTLASVGALCAVSVAIGACGGSSPSIQAPQAAVAAQHPQQASNASNLDIGRSRAQQTDKATQPKVSREHKTQRGHAIQPPEGSAVPVNKTNPCKLVSVPEAKAITGGAIVGSLEAPLGPTCVYRPAQRKTSSITLDVESSNFAQITRQMNNRHQLTIRGHRAYCGLLGSQMLYVQLPGGRILHVTAPCPLAQRFAATALSHFAA